MRRIRGKVSEELELRDYRLDLCLHGDYINKMEISEGIWTFKDT